MNLVIRLALLICIAYFILNRLLKLRDAYVHSEWSRRWGCESVTIRKNKYPWGLCHVIRLLNAEKMMRTPDEYFKIWCEQPEGCHTFKDTVLGTTGFYTISPRNVQAMLATQFEDFELGEIRRNSFGPMLGIGIFTADGEAWRRSRHLIRPQFTRDQISQLSIGEMHVEKLMGRLISNSSGWISQVNLGPLFFDFTLDSSTEFLFGQSINSQTQRQGNIEGDFRHQLDWNSFAAQFDRGTATIGIRARLADLYWLYNPPQFQKDCKDIHAFADYFVRKALERLKSGSQEGVERYIFLDELVKSDTNPVRLRSELLNLLLAGRDTTAGLLGWTCWNLSRHPLLFAELRQAVINHFGEYGSSHEITFRNLKACKILHNTIKEALRLYPPVPLNSRISTRDTTLPCGGGHNGESPIYIKKGTEIGFHVYAMHRRTDIWGDDAEEFRPERWTNIKPGWEFLPFSGGPRICLGQQFALTQVSYVLTKILQRFDRMEACFPTEEPLHHYGVTSAPKDVMVRLHEKKA